MTDIGVLERNDPHEIDLDRAFAALADPTRRAIVSRLAEGECSVNQLAAPFEISLPAISRHLKVLEQAGLISRGRDAQRRPCRLRLDALDAMGRYVVHTRAAWEQRLDRLEQFLAVTPSADGTSGRPADQTTVHPRRDPRHDHAHRRQRLSRRLPPRHVVARPGDRAHPRHRGTA